MSRKPCPGPAATLNALARPTPITKHGAISRASQRPLERHNCARHPIDCVVTPGDSEWRETSETDKRRRFHRESRVATQSHTLRVPITPLAKDSKPTSWAGHHTRIEIEE
jgi:hypothetical protein